MTEDKAAENSWSSALKDSAANVLVHPHSLVRGVSHAVAASGPLMLIDAMGGLNTLKTTSIGEFAAGVFTLGLPAFYGVANYKMHEKKEELNPLQQQAEPKKWFKNLYNKACEYTVTGLSIYTGALGAVAAIGSHVTHGVAEHIGMGSLSTSTLQAVGTGAVAGSIALFAANAASKGIRDIFGFDSDGQKANDAKASIKYKNHNNSGLGPLNP